jgi:O-antigen/teichoic acid export membrane protein
MIRAFASFIVLYILTFQLNFRIESIPIATLAIDLIVLATIFPPFFRNIKIHFNQISSDIIKNLFNYSAVGIISSLSLIMLASSDRYLIAYFGKMDEVGIYNQVYNLSQVSITALVTVFFAVINPNFMKLLENNFTGSNRLTKNYFFSFFIVLFPITVYLSMFSYQLSIILLGKDFRTGYDIIPYVMFSSFIYGMTLFPDNRLKFSSHYRQLIIGIIICSLINIILNIIFLPVFTYKFAALSTLICYSILMVYYFYLDIKKNSLSLSGWPILLPSIFTLTAEWIVDYIIRNVFEIKLELLGTFIELVIFCGIYGLVIYLFSAQSLRLFIKNFNK